VPRNPQGGASEVQALHGGEFRFARRTVRVQTQAVWFLAGAAMLWKLRRLLQICILLVGSSAMAAPLQPLRVIIETDAGGDPDDEQSLVRFLVYANEFDIAGIIANRPLARERENQNPVRDGLGIVRAQVEAYGKCQANLLQHDPRFPTAEQLLPITVAGYDDTDAGVKLILECNPWLDDPLDRTGRG
jgi:hypothetical protein